MRVRPFSELVLDVPTIVGQMDQITWELKGALDKAQSKVSFLFTAQQAQVADERLRAIDGLIRELDVGGAGREHVFFPLPGQTSEEAWITYREFAESARQSLASLGQFISQWSLAPTLARIAGDVGAEVKGDTSMIALAVGAVLALSLLGSIGQARRAFSGYRRRRRR